MPWLAALFMTLFYLYNLPVTAALVLSEKGFAAAFRPVSPAAAAKAAKKAARRPKKKSPQNPPRMLKKLRPFRIAGNLLPYITLEHFHMTARVGLDDAALTALVCGFLTSAGHMTACRAKNPGKIQISPDFNAPRLEGEICATISIPVSEILHAAVKAYVSK